MGFGLVCLYLGLGVGTVFAQGLGREEATDKTTDEATDDIRDETTDEAPSPGSPEERLDSEPLDSTSDLDDGTLLKKRRTHRPDENIDFTKLEAQLAEDLQPNKAYRHPVLGRKGYRSNLFAISGEGRTPGVGAFMTHNFNRLGMGIAASSRFFHPKVKEQKFVGSFFLTYHLIPLSVSPFILLGGEFALRMDTLQEGVAGMIIGGGIEAKIYRGWSLIIEYISHETVLESFPGLAIAYAF